MKLSYRGSSYDQDSPATETAATETTGKYRGCDWRFRNLKKPPVLQPTRNLVYRGVAYHRGEAAETTTTTPINQQARRLFLNRQQEQRNRQQAMLNRSSAEVGLAL